MPNRRDGQGRYRPPALAREPLVDVDRKPILDADVPVLHAVAERGAEISPVCVDVVDRLKIIGFGCALLFAFCTKTT